MFLCFRLLMHFCVIQSRQIACKISAFLSLISHLCAEKWFSAALFLLYLRVVACSLPFCSMIFPKNAFRAFLFPEIFQMSGNAPASFRFSEIAKRIAMSAAIISSKREWRGKFYICLIVRKITRKLTVFVSCCFSGI